VLWCYGVTGGAVPPMQGVDGAAVRGVRHAELTALVSEVPAQRFRSGALEAELEDLDRLEGLARAHEAVLAASLEAGPVVPFRLCTIYSDDDALGSALRERHAELAGTLRRVTGMAEWSVKILHRPSATSPPAAADSGADYLARKRNAREEAAAVADAATGAAGAVHDRLAELATEAMLDRPQDRRLSGHDGEMVLNASYLVPDERADVFRAAVEELAERYEPEHLHFQLAGPWPAHHFSTTEAA
jgi:hypothetical protein